MSGELDLTVVIALLVFCVIIWAFKDALGSSVSMTSSDFGGGCLGTIANAIFVLILLGIVGAVFVIVLDRFGIFSW